MNQQGYDKLYLYMVVVRELTQITRDSFSLEFMRFAALEIKNFELPIAAGAVLATLILAFPEEFKKANITEVFRIAGDLMPVLIACNDYCDVGLPAKSVNPVSHTQGVELQLLERKLWQGFYEAKKKFCGLHSKERGRLSGILDSYFHESTLLAQSRNKVDVIDFLSLDSLLFEVVCIEILVPSVLRKLQLSYDTKVTTYQDLYDKYEPYLRTKEGLSSLNKLQKKLMILHVTEMLLKLSDDEIGKEIDTILQVPSFAVSLDKEKKPYNVAEIRKMYVTILKKMGGSFFLAKTADILFTTMQKVKFYLKYGKKNYPVLELTELNTILSGSREELREKLMKSSILVDLFQNKNQSNS